MSDVTLDTVICGLMDRFQLTEGQVFINLVETNTLGPSGYTLRHMVMVQFDLAVTREQAIELCEVVWGVGGLVRVMGPTCVALFQVDFDDISLN